MVTTAYVNIWDHLAGAIAWDTDTGLGSFEYDPAFLKKNLDLAPIKMPVSGAEKKVFAFPELRRSHTFAGLPGLVADALPDKYGNALINSWLSRQGRPGDSLNPVEKLCFIGKRGMGALEFEPATRSAADEATKIELDSLVEMAEQILSGRKKIRTMLSPHDEKTLVDILKTGTSAGGARAKAVIAFNPRTKEIRSGQAEAPKGFSHWLIKFDGVTDAQSGASTGYGRVELAYYHMALDAGIEMTESALMEENGRAHFMTRRFDREKGKKIHVQSLCALRHFDFNDITLYSYEQLFETMRLLGLTYPEAEQMYRRMVFNVMGQNCDDHTKNFAFAMDQEGKWRLSPAFDVCHAYRPGSDWVSQHCLSINGKRKDITRQDLLTIGRQMNIKKADQIIEQVASVISNWPGYAAGTEVSKKLAGAINKTLLVL